MPSDVNANQKRLDTDLVLKYNKYGLYSSIVSMMTMSAVAAFRATEHMALHFGAAFFTFASFWVQFFVQTRMSYELVSIVNTLKMARIRLILTILNYIASASAYLFCFISIFQSNYSYFMSESRLLWDSSSGGYVSHVISAITENIAILLISLFYSSFIAEFNRIHSHNGKLKYKFINGKSDENVKLKPSGRQTQSAK